MLYFLHLSKKFWKSSYAELSGICRFRIIESLWDNAIIEADAGLLRRLNSSRNVFVYGALEVNGFSRIDKSRYLESVYAQVKKEAEKRERPMVIDVYDVNSKSGYSSKDIEVYLGERLEKEGSSINLDRPEVLAYAVLLNWRCYTGSAAYSRGKRMLLNPIRHYNLSRNGISRSEMKLAEAFDRFGIKTGGVAIDLGAAPGGWSGFLAKKGFSVIAIDNAVLDKKRLKAAGIRVREAKHRISAPEPGTILHKKAGFMKANELLKGIKADLLVNDMNIPASDSAAAVLMLSGSLKRDAAIIMTLKAVTKNVERQISEVKRRFKGKIAVKKIALLPSNRQELTLFCKIR